MFGQCGAEFGFSQLWAYAVHWPYWNRIRDRRLSAELFHDSPLSWPSTASL